MRLSPAWIPGILMPASSRRGAPACSIYATGGLTHFIEGEDPAGRSVARCANLLPASRASQNALKVLRSSARGRFRRCKIRSSHCNGQPRCSTSSRGKENGRSKPATQGPGWRSHASNEAKSCSDCSDSNKNVSPYKRPDATVMPLRRDGADVKSTPCTIKHSPLRSQCASGCGR